MKLKLTLQNTGDTWTLNPDRSYVLGSESGCEISLPEVSVISRRHVTFSFDDTENLWVIQDLQSTNGTFVDNQRIERYAIRAKTKISVANEITLIAEPLQNAQSFPQVTQIRSPSTLSSSLPPPLGTNSGQFPAEPPIYQPSAANNQQTFHEDVYEQERSSRKVPFPSTTNRAKSRSSNVSSKTLSWRQFVKKQVNSTKNPILRLVIWGSMTTGFRNTPWVRYFQGYNPEKSGNSFLDFDGYVLPNFQESSSKILAGIENKLLKLGEYEKTDCRIVKLTDAHLVDSASQNFIGIELFPIVRGGKSDYRRFCVTSYHRVRTYLIVENYGPDLFVSWLTRFEPVPTSIPMILWFIFALLLSISNFVIGVDSNSSNNLEIGLLIFSISFPLLIWLICYYILPLTMEYLKILPKKSNAIFLGIFLNVFALAFIFPIVLLFIRASIIFISVALILVPLLYIIYRLLNFAGSDDDDD